MKKYQEILESEKFEIIRDKCKQLVYDLFHDKLSVYKIELFNLNIKTGYSKLFIKTSKAFNNRNYKNYKELFDFLDKLNLEFDFTNGHDIDIYIDDVNDFILELEQISDTKKYNL